MAPVIDTISVKNLFYIRFRQDINFTLKSLSKEIHFTISNHPNSPDVNLHISKNINDPLIRKPSIRIAVIDKKFFEEISPLFTQTIAGCVFQPVIIKLVKKNNPNLLFFNTSKIEKDKGIAKKLIALFEPISKVKKTEFSIHGDFEGMLENFAKTYFPENAIKKQFEFSHRFSKDANFAVHPKGDSLIFYKKIDKRWYRMKQELDPISILKRFFDDNLASHFFYYTLASIEKVIAASSYEDVANFDNPVRLIRK